MGNVFSAISGQIGKTFALGALLPATVFVLVTQLFIAPMAPLELRALPIIRTIDTEWQLGLVIALSTILATLLYVLNNSILRLYQGYLWRGGLLGTWLAGRRKREVKALIEEQSTIRAKLLAVPRDEDHREEFLALNADFREVTLPILQDFPKPASALPTRLGNVIRSFENYPARQYQIAAVTLWPRFVPKLSREHATMIEDAKSGVDMLLNLSCLSYTALLLTLVLGVTFPIPFASARLLPFWLLRMAVFGLLGFAFYRAAVPVAKRWGESVRSAFDLHRLAVLKDLGFEATPETLESERALWESISQQFVYGEVVTAEAWRYRGRVVVRPSDRHLTLSRGIAILGEVRIVTVEVRNEGKDSASDVTVYEELENGREYFWGSAQVNGKTVTPTGSNPLVFRMPRIDADTSAVITYRTTIGPH